MPHGFLRDAEQLLPTWLPPFNFEREQPSMNLQNNTNREQHAYLQPLSYTIANAVKVTGLGRTSIYSLIAAGKLRAIKVGGRTLIPAASLRALIDGQG